MSENQPKSLDECRAEVEQAVGSQMSSFVEHFKEALAYKKAGDIEKATLEAEAACEAMKFVNAIPGLSWAMRAIVFYFVGV